MLTVTQVQTHLLRWWRAHAVPAGGVVVGVSGGADSLCLLDGLQAVSRSLGLSVSVAHLDHGLRATSALDADRVRAETEGRGLPFYTHRADVRAFAGAERRSIEDAARQLRYAFLAQIAAQTQAVAIAVAHTADDQAETVLMRLIRGAGVVGLGGMREVSNVQSPETEGGRGQLLAISEQLSVNSDQCPVSSPSTSLRASLPSPGSSHQPCGEAQGKSLILLRPLLALTRAATKAYCAEQGLTPLADESNADLAYFRNRVRHRLLPVLAEENPHIRATLARAATLLADQADLLAKAIEAQWQHLAQPEAERVRFERGAWLGLSLPEQRALLHRAIAHLRGSTRDAEFAPLDQAARFTRSAHPGRVCDLAFGLCVTVGVTDIHIQPWDFEAATDVPQLDDEGQLRGEWRFDVLLGGRELLPEHWAAGEGGFGPVWVAAERLPGPLRLYLRPLHLRPRHAGDRYAPLGLGGHQKLSDAFINAKIPAPLRARWPIVCAGEAIVWVPGLRLSAEFQVTAQTQTIARLMFRKLKPF
jgi:tRNA(Ile)-lysidine synthase